MSGRYDYAKAILGPDMVKRLESTRILMVGAGGIGCELLKNVTTAGFGFIEIIDLDTIDLSNLNRQFLFRKEHVKRSKALVARETAQPFNPNVKLNAIHGNIKEPRFNVDYFKSFDIVLNALDNMDARRHVNKMCMAAGVPLIESGTAGYAGQVQPIQKDTTECYDCTGKPVPKGFAVCTIRSTPSTPIHCIVWAKSYLFPQLFGPEDDNDNAELDKAAADGENADELQELRRESLAIRELRSTLGQADSEKNVFDKVFKKDIERLLSMEDMWKHRKSPKPLSYDLLMEEIASMPSTSTAASNGIKDQRELSLLDSFALFQDSLQKLSTRVKAAGAEATLDWDKDDDDALNFATAAANLRAHIFDIPSKTRFDVKQMAGNIIPAIATTNAIVAGIIVLQCLKALKNEWEACKMVWVARSADKAISTTQITKPNPACPVCRTPYIPIQLNAEKLTIRQFVNEVIRGKLKLPNEISLVESNRMILDPDFDDNEDKTFARMGLVDGTLLTVNDDDGDLEPIVFLISSLPSQSKEVFSVPNSLPPIPSKASQPEEPVEEASPHPIVGKKRSADQAELENAIKDSKRNKIDASGVILLDDSEEETQINPKQSTSQVDPHVIELD